MRTLNNLSVTEKPAYLITSKEELISERDRMEANWNDSMRSRMQTLALISVQKFGVTISNLS